MLGVSFPLRLEKIYRDLEEIIKEYKPDAMSIEELFFNNNAKTAINVAQARGVILVVARLNNLATYEYTPLQIKQAVTGYGRADKMQVQRMVKMILNKLSFPENRPFIKDLKINGNDYLIQEMKREYEKKNRQGLLSYTRQ